MKLSRLFANISCTDLNRSLTWYAALFARGPDARPMPGLAEWRWDRGAGLQLHEAVDHAGHGTLTLVVADLEAERSRITGTQIAVSPTEPFTAGLLMRLRDPDGNLTVLVETTNG